MTTDTRITRDMVVAQNLVDRYLLGKMSETEAMAFEDYYASDPETLAELETSALLIDGMQQAGRSGEIASTPGTSGNIVPLRARVRRFMARPAYGLAASVAAAALAVFVVANQLGGTSGAGAGPVAASNFPVVTLAATRGAEQGLEVAAGGASQVVFALDLGVAEAPSYSAALHTGEGDLVLTLEGLEADALESLTLAVPGRLLPDGAYGFTVRPENGRGDTLRFTFEIVRD